MQNVRPFMHNVDIWRAGKAVAGRKPNARAKKTPFFHIKANLLTINGLSRTAHIPQNKSLVKYRLLQYKKPPFTPKKHTLHAAKACFRQIERHPSARKSA